MTWRTGIPPAHAGTVAASHAAARSAERLCRLHEVYVTVAPPDAALVRIYLAEVKILIRRCLRLAWHLLTQRHTGAPR